MYSIGNVIHVVIFYIILAPVVVFKMSLHMYLEPSYRRISCRMRYGLPHPGTLLTSYCYHVALFGAGE